MPTRFHCFAMAVAWTVVFSLGLPGQTPDKTVSIFNGQDFSGWRVPSPNLWWSIADGVLLGRNDEQRTGSILWTEKTFGDFQLQLQFKFIAGTVDSGIFLRHEREQIQLGISHSLKRDMTGSPYVSGKGYPVEAEGITKLLIADDWNSLKVIARGKAYHVWLNGHRVLAYQSDTAEPQGPIGLQVHAGNTMHIGFRNLRIVEIE